MAMVGAWMAPAGIRGMTEASATTRWLTPRTASEGSTTAAGSLPMRAVPTGCQYVARFSSMNWVNGVSTRAVDDLVQALGIGTGISKSEVSRICSGLDEQVAAFRDRTLHHTTFPYVFLDATYLHVRRTGQVTSMAVVVATGVTADGGREILGVDVGDSEDEVFWRGFLRTLRERGLNGVQLVISDQHAGLVAALARQMQGVVHQRCRVHFARNLLALVPKSHKDMVAAVFRTAFAQPDAAAASQAWDEVRDQLARSFPKIGPLMDAAKAEVLAFTGFPRSHWTKIWSTNPIERINREIKTPSPRRRHLPQRRLRHPTRRSSPQRHPGRMAGQRPPLPLRNLHGPPAADQRY